MIKPKLPPSLHPIIPKNNAMNDPNNTFASGPDSHEINLEALWKQMIHEGNCCCDPLLSSFFDSCIHSHQNFKTALTCMLGKKLQDASIPYSALIELIDHVYNANPALISIGAADMIAVMTRDAACPNLITPFLFFKGFHSIQAHRIAHWLWNNDRHYLALHLQSRISEMFGVDIHPAARFGQRIMIDHATSVVVGETSIIEDDVSLLQEVTLGGTGKDEKDRHPKIRRGVLIGAGAKVLGNVEIGEGAKIGAGSIVLKSVLPYTTVVGNPARQIGVRHKDLPGLSMDLSLPSIDYVI